MAKLKKRFKIIKKYFIGIPSNAPRDATWYRFKKLNLMYKYSDKINDFYEHDMGYARYPNDRMLPYEDSLLSIYAFPEEYNFPAMRRKGWFNIEVFIIIILSL